MFASDRFSSTALAALLVALGLSACSGASSGGNGSTVVSTGGSTGSGPMSAGSGTSGAGASGAGGSGGGAGSGSTGGACAVTPQSLAVQTQNQVPSLLYVDDTDTLYAAPWGGVASDYYVMNLQTGTGNVVNANSSVNFGAQGALRLYAYQGGVYLVTGSGIESIPANGGAPVTIFSSAAGILAVDFDQNLAFYSDVNGDVGSFDLTAAPGASPTLLGHRKDLGYQAVVLSVDSTAVSLVNVNGSAYRIPRDGSPATLLYDGPQETLTGAASDGTRLYVHAYRLDGTPHAGVGQLSLSATNQKAFQWLPDARAINDAYSNQSSEPPPLLLDSLILTPLANPQNGFSDSVNFTRYVRATGASCVFLTANEPYGVYATAGGHSYAWVEISANSSGQTIGYSLRWVTFPN